MKRSIKYIATCVLLAALPAVSQAGVIVDLIENGEFERTNKDPGSSWTRATDVAGWSSTEGHIELFSQGFASSPARGTDGELTGLHAEITGDSQLGIISTTFVIPENVLPGSMGLLSFDLWNRAGEGITLNLLVEQPQLAQPPLPTIGGALPCIQEGGDGGPCLLPDITGSAGSPSTPIVDALNETFSDEKANSDWVRVTRSVAVNPGELFTLSFGAVGGGTAGAHIDQVAFLVEEAGQISGLGEQASVPAPATLALFALGLLGLLRRRAV
ncbi:PEP-CTERM sorting domain-containing protein [Congregibacter litoralis]|uniref:PEP-CTERM protein sorting domain protein n=1 Tax=Congregibacter litoralis KT71 TaxID=314285 RepID=A4A581_9GAMM|nr:PEP-CTERM sorting domain-containing protein [Congregibacter litoralis]EAQ98952.1 PEP-CTERM protein sorting domain protein [Congregibacter litoralis KT71]